MKKIEHIVVSGGGIIFFPYYGYLRETAKKKVWDLKKYKNNLWNFCRSYNRFSIMSTNGLGCVR